MTTDTGPSEGQPELRPTAEAVEADMVRLVYDHSRAGLVITAINSLLLVLVVRNQVPDALLCLWLGFLYIVLALRYVLLHWYNQSESARPARFWSNLFTLGAAMTGLGWGAAPVLLFAYLPPPHQAFLILLIGGMMSSATPFLANIKAAYLLYSSLTLLPLAGVLLTYGEDPMYPASGGVALLLLGMMQFIARRMNRVSTESVALRYENVHLVEDLKDSEAKFRALTESSASSIFIIQDETFAYINNSGLEITGYTLNELKAMRFIDVVHPDFRNMVYQRAQARLRGGKQDEAPMRYEFKLLGKDGREPWVDFTGVLMDYQSRPAILGTCFDITYRKEAEAKLRELAHTDPLTGISNRRRFIDRTAEEIVRSRRFNHPLALLGIDVDHFKKVNDSMGHNAGDEALRQLAVLMSSRRRQVDVLGRVGGEEFSLLLPETDLEQARQVAERLRRTVEEAPIDLFGEKSIHMTISVGLAVLTEHDDVERLMVRADRALYLAKKNGRNRVESCEDADCCPVISLDD